MIPEFSRPFVATDISRRGTGFSITATPKECAALAKRFAILEVVSLSAQGRLTLAGDGPLIKLEARLTAQVVQACVVTLEPVPASVDESFTVTFGAVADEETADDLDLAFDSPDPPDPIIDNLVDVGESVAEHLALSLDPFPRSPGAAFELPPPEEPEKRHPFAVLSTLMKKGT